MRISDWSSDVCSSDLQMEGHFLDRLFALRELPVVTDIRGIGLLGAFDMAPDGAPGARGYRVLKDLYEAGVFTKMTADTVILAPPFIAEKQDIDKMYDIKIGRAHV